MKLQKNIDKLMWDVSCQAALEDDIKKCIFEIIDDAENWEKDLTVLKIDTATLRQMFIYLIETDNPLGE